MHNKEEKNTSKMPLLGWESEDKIYIHPESGDEINLGPFFEFVYHINQPREEASIEEGEKHNKKLRDLTDQFNSLIADRDWDTKELAKILKDFV